MEVSSVIDLFAGCGGLSTGFEMAGFEIPVAIERDAWAGETYAKNHKNTHVIVEDITKVKFNEVKREGKTFPVDGIIGGPPCQGFSLSGNRDKDDPRNSLFMEFVRFVKNFAPKFFVMENVPGLLSMKTKKGEAVKDVILREFRMAGYQTTYYQVNAAEFGVPQTRTRVVFIGVKEGLPFNAGELEPKGNFSRNQQITIEQAIMDLPQIAAREGKDFYPYETEATNAFQRWAREGSDGIYNHIAMRHTDRLVKRFAQIGYGQSVSNVSKEHQQRKRGNANQLSGKSYSQNNMRPYPDKPSPTIAASFQSNFVHPYINRNFTAREGARLQSFPDRYVFCGKRTTMSWEKNLSQYQQIGNAVPPLLAKGIGDTIKKYFNTI